ncbi:YbaK/EbsC family protein [Ruegeria sp. WL0004]|uniref:YbaK/EbsC family protein n=1 Tax=Ruegeria marisflavi TaxID=2984152 RepID=A0ABT2WLW4_9RHOB|nr:YbaK/EbsC family protein [Ruegeria sp. WL0004]MCU9836894.1 YbaK/EbsC family protein [Ruegeria sp. WL0004]
MSKSLSRVRSALHAAGVAPRIQETGNARTARDAAAAAAAAIGCERDQIVKTIVFEGVDSGSLLLFLTAGGNQVDTALAATLAGEDLKRAAPDNVRKTTGFAVGGVSPIGHLSPARAFMDPRLMEFTLVWAAAGTPRHVFAISPRELAALTKAERATFTTGI